MGSTETSHEASESSPPPGSGSASQSRGADEASESDDGILSSFGVIERELISAKVLVQSLRTELKEQKSVCNAVRDDLASTNLKKKQLMENSLVLLEKNSRLGDELAAVRTGLLCGACLCLLLYDWIALGPCGWISVVRHLVNASVPARCLEACMCQLISFVLATASPISLSCIQRYGDAAVRKHQRR